jgi:hypothetical protein
MPNSFLQNAQIMQPILNAVYSPAPASGDIGFGDQMVALAQAQPGISSPAQAIANLASGGPIGSAAQTVDNGQVFLVNQTTAGQTISLPSPSNPSVVRTVHVVNNGSTPFTISGVSVSPGVAKQHLWHGSAWVPMA